MPIDGPNGYSCEVCDFSLWLPIADLVVSSLGLYDDARFPGRCILAFKEHVEDLLELDEGQAAAFIHDAQEAGRAITAATRPDRINYAVLGNVVPHLHIHLIPRYWASDPIPNRPPWEHPAEKTSLAAGEVSRLTDAIRLELEGRQRRSRIRPGHAA